MKTKRLFFLLTISIVLNACGNKSNNAETKVVAASQNETHYIDFTQTDSIQLYYYPQSKNQKEFKTYLIKDTSFVKSITDNLALPTVEKNACEHPAKMYLYKNGNVYKTAYAALNDSCQYLAYIVNGEPLFVPLNKEVENRLKQLIQTMN